MYNNDISESIKWLKSREGFSPRPYNDYKQQSIGYGTGNTGLSSINEEDASKILENEVINRRAQLGKDYPQGISNWEVTEGGKKVESVGLTNRINDLKARRGPAQTPEMMYEPDNRKLEDLYSRYQRLVQPPRIGQQDDGFRMAGVEGGEQPRTSIDMNKLFSNDVPELNTLPKTTFTPIAQPESINPTQQEEINPIQEVQPVNQTQMDGVVDNNLKLTTAFDNYKAPQSGSTEEINPLNSLLASYIEQKRLAEDRDNKTRLLANLGRAGSTIGAAIGGIKTPDQSFYKDIADNSGRNVASVDKELSATMGVNRLISEEKQAKDAMDSKREYMKGMLEQARINAAERAKEKDIKDQDRKEERDVKDMEYLAKFGTAADNARSQTPLGNAGMTVRRSNVLKALAGRTGGKVTSTEVKELAAVTDALLRGGNTAVGTLKMLLPNDVNATQQKVMEWITSDPYAVDRKEFMDRLINIADSEQAVAEATIKENLFSQLAPRFGNLAQLSKPEVALYLKEKGIYDDLVNFAKGQQRESKYIDTAMEKVKESHDKSMGKVPTSGTIERLDPKTGKIALFDKNKKFIGWK